MMNNNNYFGNPYVNYGYVQPKLPDPTNPLSKEEMNLLRQKAPQFSLAVSQVDNLKAICTHRDSTGEKLIRNTTDGTVTCEICGTTFRPVQAPQEQIDEAFKTVVDILETMKIMYMDIPNDVTKTYFQMIPYLEKGPQLYKIATDHFSRYSNTGVMSRDFNSGANAFALYSAMMNPGMMMGMGMPQQQMGFGQPGMAMNPQQPNMGMPVQDVTTGANNGMNPFDVGSAPAMNAAQQTTTDNKQYSL